VDLAALARRRWEALRPALWRIAQAAVAASAAWWLAGRIPHHPQPFFAPIAAVIAMGAAPGTRGKQALELITGVALGITVAALIVWAAGTGTWQIGLAGGLGMVVGVLLSEGRPVIVTQSAASAVLLIALHRPGAAPGRLIDALIGGGVAIAMAQILLPIDPLRVVSEAARAQGDELARAVDEVAHALRDHDADRARRALMLVEAIDGRRLADALRMAHGVVRRAPRRRWERRAVEGYGAVAQELGSAVADATALASGALRALRDDRTVVPPEAAEAAAALAQALRGPDVAGAGAEACALASRALEAAPSLGMSVFVHAVETVARHAERAAAAVDDARARTRRPRSRVLGA
jgi:hypothetical protein